MNKNYIIIGWMLLSLLGMSCIGDDIIEDFVEPELRLLNAVDTLAFGTEYQFEVEFFNNVGVPDPTMEVTWSSADANIISITPDGLATAVNAGQTTISAAATTANGTITESLEVVVGENTVSASSGKKEGIIRTTSSYELRGDFTMEADGSNVIINIADNYFATSALPGLYLYLSNNSRSIAGALEISEVEVFSGAHNYEVLNVGVDDFKYLLFYCKPFNVKVGDAEIVDSM